MIKLAILAVFYLPNSIKKEMTAQTLLLENFFLKGLSLAMNVGELSLDLASISSGSARLHRDILVFLGIGVEETGR